MAGDGFCVLPWTHLFADEQGVTWPCCRSVTTEHPNRDDASGEPLRIGGGRSLDDVRNSTTMRALRQAMLAGEKPPACERCYAAEGYGIHSHRQSVNAARGAAGIEALVAQTADNGAITTPLESLDLRLGNLCNLRCRMCSPHSSKALLREWAQKHDVPLEHTYFDQFRDLRWFEDEHLWAGIEASPALGRVHFAGGEPLLIPAMYAYLERMVEQGKAGELTISYNTNLTVLPDRVLALWKHFKAVRVTISLDGHGAVNDFIRYPARWERIAANIHRLDRARASGDLDGELGTNSAVQVFNVFRIGVLLDYLADATSTLGLPNLSIVTHPPHLSLRILPPELKHLAAQRVADAIAQSGPKWRARWGAAAGDLIAALDGIVDYMLAADDSEHLPEFLAWARHQDGFRRQNTAMAIPELAPLFAATTPLPTPVPAFGE